MNMIKVYAGHFLYYLYNVQNVFILSVSEAKYT
jgi:hypothetical protein